MTTYEYRIYHRKYDGTTQCMDDSDPFIYNDLSLTQFINTIANNGCGWELVSMTSVRRQYYNWADEVEYLIFKRPK